MSSRTSLQEDKARLREQPALIVSSNRRTAAELRALLWGEGFRFIEEALSGASALALFHWHDFGLVLIADMPEDANRLADAIRQRWGNTPCLLLQANEDRERSVVPDNGGNLTRLPAVLTSSIVYGSAMAA